jgi:hypothetical protein
VIELTGVRHGKPVLKDGSGGRKGGLTFRVDDVNYCTDWSGVPQAERPAFIARAIRTVEKKHGVDGWYWNRDRGPSSEPVATSGAGAKKRQLWSLCSEFFGDPWHRSSQCGRPILDEGAPACGIHVAAQRRSDESMNAHRERWAAQNERRRIALMQTADLVELWERACFEFGIEPERQGNPRVTETGQAQVNVEILEMFLRRLAEPEL